MKERIQKIVSVILIALMLSVHNVPLVLAEEISPSPEPVQTSSSTDTSSTNTTDQSSQTSGSTTPTTNPQPTPDTNAQSNINGEPDYDMDASDPDNAARKYRAWLKEQEAIKKAQEDAAKAAAANATPTPGQSANGNTPATGDAVVNTGDATNTASASNYGNNNTSGPSAQVGSGSGASVVNDGNGSGSNNDGSASIVNNNTTNQSNSATIHTNLNQSATTGNNQANDNTGVDSSITTGDANVTGNVVTAINTNAAGIMVSEFNIADDHMGDYVLDFGANCVIGCGGSTALAQNSNNGSDSTNNANVDVTNNNTTFQNNDAVIGNDLVLSADTGNNSASGNTKGDSTIQTGDANVVANVMTFANNNIAGNVVLGVVNIFGSLVGDIIFPEDEFNNCCGGNIAAGNSNNGSGSTNNANVEITNNDNYFQTNDAEIINNLTFDANTGENEASGNTGGNSTINSGDANVDVNVLNIANSNLIGGNWWLVLVNEGGNWVGKIAVTRFFCKFVIILKFTPSLL